MSWRHRILLLTVLSSCLVPGLGLGLVRAQDKKQPASKADKARAAKDKASTRDLALEKAVLQATAKTQTTHLKALEPIVTWAAQGGLKAEAEGLLKTMEALDPAHAGLKKLRAAVAKATPVTDESKVKELRDQLTKKLEGANDKNAQRLFKLAEQCMKLSLFTRAYDLVQAVVEADPDHKRARGVLSYAWDATTRMWITKWESERKKTHFITDEGWIPKKDKAKWDKGLRDYQGKWISKEEEERIRKRNSFNPFAVESEHFNVQTNLGRKQAWEFAQLLEDFHGQFFRFYIGFYDQKAGAELLFNQARQQKKHRVMVFPSREDYLTFVKSEKGNDELLQGSAGFWAGADQRSYFFWQEGGHALSTLYHEVTHQLFGETKPGSGNSKGNNWVVEGIATYMETWEKVKGKWLPGHKLDDPELRHAKSFLDGNASFNLQAFLAIGHEEFHKENRSLNYALAGALCHFLMHADDEIYREPFIRFISAYYGGKVVEDSLGDYLQVEGASGKAATIAALETKLKAYMANLGQETKPGASGEAAGGADDAAAPGN